METANEIWKRRLKANGGPSTTTNFKPLCMLGTSIKDLVNPLETDLVSAIRNAAYLIGLSEGPISRLSGEILVKKFRTARKETNILREYSC